MTKIILALFIMAHGLVHAALAIAPDPTDPNVKLGAFFTSKERSWLLSQMGMGETAVQWIGLLLVVLSAAGFVLAGLGLFGVLGLSIVWRIVAVVSACISLLLLILFWHPWLPIGVLINVAVLVTLLWAKWPPQTLVGS